MGGGEVHACQDIHLGAVHQIRRLARPGAQSIGDLAPSGVGDDDGFLGEGGDDAAALFPGT